MIRKLYENFLDGLSSFSNYLSLREFFSREDLDIIEETVRISRREALLEKRISNDYEPD